MTQTCKSMCLVAWITTAMTALGPVRCYHCGEPHPASSKECELFRFEKEVLHIRNQERVSFVEAKQFALTKMSSPRMTYASGLSAHAHRRSNIAKSIHPTTSLMPEKAAAYPKPLLMAAVSPIS